MAFQEGHAVVIGVGTHKDHPHLDKKVTVADAEAVANVLIDAHACGYLQAQVSLLHDAGATKAGILASLDQLAARTSEKDTAFLFFCGHGALGTDGNYYLLGHDVRLDDQRVVAGTGVSEAELLAKLRAVKARRMLMVFNACHSGNISPTLAPEPQSLDTGNPDADAAAALLGTGEGRIILVASREKQFSYIGKGALTIFTQSLIDGLRGNGVRNSNGFISAFSLYEHVFETVVEEVKDRYGDVQEPELTVLKGVGPFAVALYRGASTLGSFEPDEPLPTGMAVREVSKEKSERRFSQHINTGGGAYVGGNVNTGGGAFVGGNLNVGGEFIGRDKIVHGDEVRGDKVMGDKVGGDKITTGPISGTGIAIGRGAQSNVSQGISGAELDRLFAPLMSLARDLPRDKAAPAEQKVEELKQEAAKGKSADDGRMATLIDGLVRLVPGAVGAVVSMFANPILGGIAGPVTKFVLDRLQ